MDSKFDHAVREFDEVNRQDPRVESDGETSLPKEYLYSLRMSAMLDWFSPDAPEAVRLAARCQHIRRWDIPRSSFPAGRDAYRAWRTELANHHASVAGPILDSVGYNLSTVIEVQSLLKKEHLKTNPNCQLLEDVIGLVFIQFYLRGFAPSHQPEKLSSIVRKTWAKMSLQGREAALKLELDSATRDIVAQSLGE